jgi:putative transcriptional regulator
MRKKKSSILDVVHDTAIGLHRAGAIDLATLREFNRLCLSQKFEQHR